MSNHQWQPTQSLYKNENHKSDNLDLNCLYSSTSYLIVIIVIIVYNNGLKITKNYLAQSTNNVILIPVRITKIKFGQPKIVRIEKVT